MSSRRTLILIASIAIGAVAAFALFNYVSGIEDDAYSNAERVDVYVVRQTIPKGYPGEQARAQGFIVQDKIPREFLPPTAISSLDQVDGKVALTQLAANQVLVDGMFVDAAEAMIGFSERLSDDEVAVTISVDQVRGVAGLLVPGDRVNMLVTTDAVLSETSPDAEEDPIFGFAEEEGPEAASPYSSPARYLYQKVRILAIGQNTVPEPGEVVDPTAMISDGLITFAVPAEAAQRIASVDASNIYLTLVPQEWVPVPLPPLDITELLPGEDPEYLTPYGPTAAGLQ